MPELSFIITLLAEVSGIASPGTPLTCGSVAKSKVADKLAGLASIASKGGESAIKIARVLTAATDAATAQAANNKNTVRFIQIPPIYSNSSRRNNLSPAIS
jgi:hypothetical protein